MVLAGGNDQAELIRRLRNRVDGVEIILIDYSKDVIAAKYADRHIVESTMDLPKVKEIAQQEKVDYIMTACGDQPVLTMAVVSEELGLPCYLSKKQAIDITNKKFMKKIMWDNNIPTARFKTFELGEPINETGLNYPLIVKPVDNNGSKGVRRVENHEELIQYAELAYKFSLTKTIVVEEFIEGDEISCDYFVKNGKANYVMICKSNKFFVDDGTQVIYQSIIPPDVSDIVRAKISDIAQKIAEAYGLINSPLHIQTLVKGDNVDVIEFSARLGGGAKYKTIQNVTGFNILNANIDVMFGLVPEISFNRSPKRFTRCFLYLTGGTFASATGFEENVNDGTIDEYVMIRPFGVYAQSPRASNDRVASLLVSDVDQNRLKEKVKKALLSIHIYNEKGEDILKRDMYQDWLE